MDPEDRRGMAANKGVASDRIGFRTSEFTASPLGFVVPRVYSVDWYLVPCVCAPCL